MIEKDYILKMLNQFFKALDEVFNGGNKNSKEYVELSLDRLSYEYLGKNIDFIVSSNSDSVINYLSTISEERDYWDRVEIVANLLLLFANNQEDILLQRKTLKQSLLFF